MANKYTDAAFAVRGLKPVQKLVLWVVCQRTDNADGTCYPSYTRIAEDAGVHRTTAIKAVKELITRGLIAIVGHHGANRYKVSLSKMQELSTATSRSADVVENSYSASSFPLPEELPTATTLVASCYSNSSGNSSSNEVKEGNERRPTLVPSLGNSGSGTALPATPEVSPCSTATRAQPEVEACGPAEPCKRLTRLMVSLLGNSPDLLAPAAADEMQAKATVALEHFTYEDLEPVLRWVLSPDSDEPNWRWREIIAGASNPMAMFAKKVLIIVNKFNAYQRKRTVKASHPAKSSTQKSPPQMTDNLKALWGDVQSFNTAKENSR